MIRKMNQREFENVYEQQMKGDFPESELKSAAHIEKLMEEGRYEFFGLYEEGQLLAYAGIIHEKDSRLCLLDYLAVCRDGRDKGTGSRFLNELYQTIQPELWILEVEDPAFASDEEERVIRERRMAFYHRNHILDTSMLTRQFGVELSILYRSEKWSGKEAEEEIYKALDQIYGFVFGEKYKRGEVAFVNKVRP